MLDGTYDAFGLLRKSYRNTIEIANYANAILQHGAFAVYPVEPVIRHGAAVRVEEKPDEVMLFAEMVRTIKTWTGTDGYETIAVICRDEEQAKAVSGQLQPQVVIADSDPKTAQFGDGVFVLPVAYTKGLEFDAVILYNPTRTQYPSDDGHVKLLYVAATRALHELAVFYTGTLSGILADPLPDKKQIPVMQAETLTKAKEYERKMFTQKEREQQRRVQGERERRDRCYIGPKPIQADAIQKQKTAERHKAVVAERAGMKPPKPSAYEEETRKRLHKKSVYEEQGAIHAVKKESKAPAIERINPSVYAFGAIPDNRLLPVHVHDHVDYAVKKVRKKKESIDLANAAGRLRLTPITPEILRISYVKGAETEIGDTYWQARPNRPVAWSAKESGAIVKVSTEKLTVVVDKKTGAMRFEKADGTFLLQEKQTEPRLIVKDQTWEFFDWEPTEKINAKGVLATDLLVLRSKAKYISFGQKAMRMPLVLSGKGYGLGIAAKETVLLCNIKTYGPYVSTVGDGQIDYYFIYGGDNEKTISLYKGL